MPTSPPMARLVIEVDGIDHTTDGATAHDFRRTVYIESQGYQVLRFTTRQVLGELDGVSKTRHLARFRRSQVTAEGVRRQTYRSADPTRPQKERRDRPLGAEGRLGRAAACGGR